MQPYAIKAERLSKGYFIDPINTKSVSRDFERWIAKLKGKTDPYLTIGATLTGTKESNKICWALNDINFEIRTGETIGLSGPNGAGKSTLLKIISRITTPTSGKISGHGKLISLLEIGSGFHPELTGLENIYLNGAMLGMRKKEITQKLDEMICFSGIGQFIETPVKRYSSGMYTRLAFSMATHLDSDILILDEILAVGDLNFQLKCLQKIKELSDKHNKTTILVSHNTDHIRNICDREIHLLNGKII